MYFGAHLVFYKVYWKFPTNENLKMSVALLSRFDLIFILLDKPDELLDKQLSEHIMAVSKYCLLTL